MGDGNGVETTKILYIHVWNHQSINKTNFFLSWSYKFKPLIFLCFQFNFKNLFFNKQFCSHTRCCDRVWPPLLSSPNSDSCSPLRLPATHFAAFVIFSVAFWVLLESLAWTWQGFYWSMENSPCIAPWRKITPPPPSLGQRCFWLHCRDSLLAKG